MYGLRWRVKQLKKIQLSIKILRKGNDTINNKSLISNILDVINMSIARAGYKVLDGDEESIIVRNLDADQDFQIKVNELIS